MLHEKARHLAALISFAILASGVPAAQIGWVTFTENLGLLGPAPGDVSAPGLNGVETDLAWGDVDKNGWVDLVVVRKQPFSFPGKRTNLLLMNELGVLLDRSTELASCSDVSGTSSPSSATHRWAPAWLSRP